jgi:hypothetical protein
MEIEKKQSETGYNDPIFIEKMDALNAHGAEIGDKFISIVKDLKDTKNKLFVAFDNIKKLDD